MKPTFRRFSSVAAIFRQQRAGQSQQAMVNTLLFVLLGLLSSCGGGQGANRLPPPPPPGPSVTGISPASGRALGGTVVTITGSGFASGAAVSIGGAICTSPSVVSGTQITCTTGARSAGPADVVVVNPGGSRGALAAGFTYVTVFFVDGSGPNGINKNPSQDAMTPVVASLAGRLYAAWNEISAANGVWQIRTAAYNGDDGAPAWRFIDGNGVLGLNKDATQVAFDPRLIVFDSKVYAAWSERSAATNASQIRVAVYNGNEGAPAWRFVDGNGPNGINKNVARNAATPQLAVFHSKLYVTWSEADNGNITEIRATVYNSDDAAPTWTFVDGDGPTTGLNKNPAKSASEPTLMAFDSKLYAAWEEVGGNGNYQIRVAAYDEGIASWNFVDGNGDNGLSKNPSASSFAAALIVYNSKLYATWLENVDLSPFQLRAVVYNDSDSSWKFVDGNGANGINHDPRLYAAYPTDFPALMVVGNSLYCSWREGFTPIAVDQIRLATYNGNDNSPVWLFADGNDAIGLNKNPSRNAGAVQLGVLNSKLYLVWQEENANLKLQIRVAVAAMN